MNTTSQTLPVSRGAYRLHVEVVPGSEVPVVLMHGFPDSTRLYDRLLPHLTGRRPVVRFDFFGWGRSDKPAGYPYTAANQAADLAAVADAAGEHFGAGKLVLVAHDASGPPAIDWVLANPGRIASLVLPTASARRRRALRLSRPAAAGGRPHRRRISPNAHGGHHAESGPGSDGFPAAARTTSVLVGR